MLRLAAFAAFAFMTAAPAAAQLYVPPGVLNDRETQEFKRREGRGDYAGALEILTKTGGLEGKIQSCSEDFREPLFIVRCTLQAAGMELARREYDAALRASKK